MIEQRVRLVTMQYCAQCTLHIDIEFLQGMMTKWDYLLGQNGGVKIRICNSGMQLTLEEEQDHKTVW